ncbi:MAG TPA: NAD(P)H-binding protein [Kofleriaceae bacterium]|nr:NAD(P)H-binding protein [Kofleriaceae bacterium]
MKIVVLGGTGSLGRSIVEKATAAGHDVVAASRSGAVKVDVTTGQGLAEAFAGVDVIMDATNAQAGAHDVLVGGTKRVLEAAAAAGVRHFVGISIVGIDDAPLAYYRTKVAQEKVIEASAVPWTLLRATQFHDLIPKLAAPKLGIVFAPRGFKIQPIDVREVAAVLVDAVAAGPQKRIPDVGGPEVRDFGDLARRWKRAAHKKRLVVRMPVPGATGAFLRAGKLCCPDRAIGKTTFESWLAETYGTR